ncbi:uncharacterized protein EV420DRAFT_1556000 [Desarmillaria tabescens]|uniref:F-box domain-containing protein n=1 Tax=Armillaria tabescens TaxID=1929756 RepID=A0AA39K6K4_ARMTA|nr:uncharacterized protein EV420DRAFT_1556000 [Desarmillaria tabescens]KAK0454271.1 hypothetical protein EV420DRAFT_1556000 [Desarmillaria tabescens]
MSSTTTTQSSFPTELIEEILDHVDCLPVKDIQSLLSHSSAGYKGGRVATLASCSLVSRAWHPRSRFHLFKSVNVTPENYASFFSLLATPGCTFLHSVHELFLSDEYRAGTIYSGCTDPEGDDYWLHKVLPDLAFSMFANIERLIIHAARFDYMSEEGFAQMLIYLSGPTTITHLALRYCVFPTQNHLIQALSSVKSLESVYLMCPTLRIIPEGEDLTRSPIPALSPSLSSLMINIDSAMNIVWMARLISIVGASLKHLSTALWARMVTWDKCMDEFYDALSFDCHPNLETIAFDYLSTSKPDGRKKTRHVPAILRKITSSSIRQIILTLSDTRSGLEDPEDLDSVDWAAISEVLSEKNYSDLESISVLRVDYHLLDKAMRIIANRMKGSLVKNPSLGVEVWYQREAVTFPLFGW